MGLNMDGGAVAVAPQPNQWRRRRRRQANTAEGGGGGGLQMKRKIMQGLEGKEGGREGIGGLGGCREFGASVSKQLFSR